MTLPVDLTLDGAEISGDSDSTSSLSFHPSLFSPRSLFLVPYFQRISSFLSSREVLVLRNISCNCPHSDLRKEWVYVAVIEALLGNYLCDEFREGCRSPLTCRPRSHLAGGDARNTITSIYETAKNHSAHFCNTNKDICVIINAIIIIVIPALVLLPLCT